MVISDDDMGSLRDRNKFHVMERYQFLQQLDENLESPILGQHQEKNHW